MRDRVLKTIKIVCSATKAELELAIAKQHASGEWQIAPGGSPPQAFPPGTNAQTPPPAKK